MSLALQSRLRPPGALRRALDLRKAWLAIDGNPAALAFVATPTGGLCAWGAFMLACAASLQISAPHLALGGAALLAVVFWPRRRLAIVSAASVIFFLARPYRTSEWAVLTGDLATANGFRGDLLQSVVAAVFLVFAIAFLRLQRIAPAALPSRRPLLALIVLWFAAFAAALAVPATSPGGMLLWTMAGVCVSSMWMLAYVASDQKAGVRVPDGARATMVRPFWGGGAEGIGKSWGYLAKFDARTPAELAATRLKAVKLAVWGLLLALVWTVADRAFYTELGLLPITDAVLAHAAGQGRGSLHGWASVVANYAVDLLAISVWGHLIVASVRMLGYRIPRNTFNPLASRTIAEFWNRYFFYFKEMLVDFFFYPAFVRFFRANIKLRIAFATLCAAGLGNFLFHFMRETHVFATKHWLEALAGFQSAAVYSALLAAGLIISQWRGRKPLPEHGFFAYQVRPRLAVIGFFCLLKIFDDLSGEGSLGERFSFALSLIGIGT